MAHKTYVTFGFSHTHSVNGHTLDHDSVAVIESEGPDEGRAKAFELFGPKFSMEYPEGQFDHSSIEKYYPRGLINVN